MNIYRFKDQKMLKSNEKHAKYTIPKLNTQNFTGQILALLGE